MFYNISPETHTSLKSLLATQFEKGKFPSFQIVMAGDGDNMNCFLASVNATKNISYSNNVCREIGWLLSFVYIFVWVAQRCC
jgi:hypothetical protein